MFTINRAVDTHFSGPRRGQAIPTQAGCLPISRCSSEVRRGEMSTSRRGSALATLLATGRTEKNEPCPRHIAFELWASNFSPAGDGDALNFCLPRSRLHGYLFRYIRTIGCERFLIRPCWQATHSKEPPAARAMPRRHHLVYIKHCTNCSCLVYFCVNLLFINSECLRRTLFCR
jgi:hypothetical protein